MNREVAAECTMLSDQEKISFPEVVMKLSKEGFDAYQANLLIPNKVYYHGNEVCEVPLHLKGKPAAVGQFNEEKVVKALRSIQSQQIGYQEFLRQIMEGGVIFYLVFIKGRKAVYFGRNGEQYVENFP